MRVYKITCVLAALLLVGCASVYHTESTVLRKGERIPSARNYENPDRIVRITSQGVWISRPLGSIFCPYDESISLGNREVIVFKKHTSNEVQLTLVSEIEPRGLSRMAF